MTMYSDARGRVVDVGSSPGLRLLGLGISAFLVVIFLFASVTRVQSGHVGVLTLFGRVTGEVLPEGIHMINPFKSSNEMSIRTQEIKESASVPSAEGLVMNLDTSLIYHLDPEKASAVYQKIGPNYLNVFIEPNLRAAIREATASHTANALYSGERELVAKQIRDQLTTLLGQRGILVESILLRDIQLPLTLKTSIETKQQAEQEALAMNFRLQKEKQEAERKRIAKLRYIHRNPVKRGLVIRPDEWPWSSYRYYAKGEVGVVEIESQWTARKREWAGVFPTVKVRSLTENPRPSKA